jgi:hypothetical protein
MTIITKKTTRKEISKVLKTKNTKRKVMDIKKFAGKLSWKGDPLEIQRQMRDDR